MRETMTFEEYAALKGASFGNIGDAGLHKTRSNISQKAWKRKVMLSMMKDKEIMRKREILRKEYNDLVSNGVFREPTLDEIRIKKASGHDDNLSVQAARRLLKKKGVL